MQIEYKGFQEYYFYHKTLILKYNCINLFIAHAIGIRGVEQGMEVKINRIVLQTLTFTSGT